MPSSVSHIALELPPAVGVLGGPDIPGAQHVGRVLVDELGHWLYNGSGELPSMAARLLGMGALSLCRL